MLRISWQLAFFAAVVIALVARKPRLIGWVLLAFGLWFVIESGRGRGRRR